MELTPLKEIPIRFVRKTLTDYQKEQIQIKYYIKLAMDQWDGTKMDLYEELTEHMPFSIHTIRKLAQAL